jgi:hypothetical protein
LVAAVLLLASCGGLHHETAQSYSPSEIADNPAMLYDNSVPREEMTLRGVRLGDPQAAIRSTRILKQADAGWIVCRDGARYQITDGSVATLGVWDRKILDQLDLKTPADIESRFGKPDSKDDLKDVVIYHFRSGKVAVIWNNFEKQVNAVNVSR